MNLPSLADVASEIDATEGEWGMENQRQNEMDPVNEASNQAMQRTADRPCA